MMNTTTKVTAQFVAVAAASGYAAFRFQMWRVRRNLAATLVQTITQAIADDAAEQEDNVKSCSTCAFSVPDATEDDMVMVCNLMPPTVLKLEDGTTSSVWPIVIAEHSCHQWTPTADVPVVIS